MDTTKGIRERRQERIRKIMSENQSPVWSYSMDSYPSEQIGPEPPSGWQPQPLPQELQALPIMTADKGDRDPEQLWKSQANPWESAGWRIAPHAGASMGSGGKRDDEPRYPSFARGLFIQSAVAAAVFVIVFAMFRIEGPMFKKGQEIVAIALTDEIDFERAADWYRNTFAGAPSFIPLFGSDQPGESKQVEGNVSLPVTAPLENGTIVRSFAETLGSVEIAGESEAEIVAAETGRVLLVTEEEKTGKTVVLQHANERVTVYGGLEKVAVAVGDWVEGGDGLGHLAAAGENESSLLFFAVKEKNRYVNPADVVPFD
ncbi:M23 family metallopeptidase [Paenibacillus oenotherae]|uniref:M23 family metallopeptidase n=1 Tax=Paenibacillus oenotherae TaxID=1435645 RepID=A0ABS7D8L8_9BACL|nr:M23 family metallopeptidase [Paenibacillus oenotherae]MBW7476220.1 M23 family metallopeptidase [Paenibacillus oenotherae]